jgi:ComF family protein
MLLTPLLALLAPHDCVGCGAEGMLLCYQCQSQLVPPTRRCYSCHIKAGGWKTCRICLLASPLWRVQSVAQYDGFAKDLLWKLKFGRAVAGAQEIGRLLAAAWEVSTDRSILVTSVPTAPVRVRQRGYDQAALIAKAFAVEAGFVYAPLLRRSGKQKQVGANKAQRMQQIQNAYRPINTRHTNGSAILIIDDVLTTGATLESCAKVLVRAGARSVEGMAFAQA